MKLNIMVVDDIHANLRLLSDILGAGDYTVRPVPDGNLALTAARSVPPDLILLDIMMPGMDGYEVCRYLKADARTADIPVIFVSAKDETIDKVRAFSAGGVDYITKPFQAEEVLARVRTHLSIRKLQHHLEEKNRELADALDQLKAAQHQIIHQEKMAALGQLVAGIAHEINTPLGAIRASAENISHATESSFDQIPKIFQKLSQQHQDDFFLFLREAVRNNPPLSSRETRNLRRVLKEELESRGIASAELLAGILANMGFGGDISRFVSLLKEKENTFIMQTAYTLFMQKSNSDNIVKAVERASKTVFALKSYVHYDPSGKMIRAKLSEGIDVVLTLYHNQLKKGIEVIAEYEDVPDILCYPDELNQVWTNLIHNAVYAMNGSGKLKIGISQDNDFAAVAISDSGSGIIPEIQEHIFDPFFTTKPAGEGSGLGLDIVRKIIERHRGRITVESRTGETTFKVFLPKQIVAESQTI